MRTIEFDLDEFRPWPALSVYVYGTATLSYEYEPDDPDVGYRGGVTYPTLERLVISSDLAKDAPIEITAEHPLYAPIAAILEGTDYAVEACDEDWQEHCDYDHDD
jgi:hypothetical protein